MQETEFVEAVATGLREGAARLPEGQRAVVSGLVERLHEPVRVLVGGKVKAGKSTIVNALLGQPVAPTDVSECTRVVTWFRYGSPQRVELHTTDGGTRQLQLTPDGRLPRALGVPLAQVVRLDAFLTNPALRTMTLIDTPGVGAFRDGLDSHSTSLLGTGQPDDPTAEEADVVVFVLNQALTGGEHSLLQAWGGSAEGPFTTVLGVLGRADELGGPGGDPTEAADDLAEHLGEVLRADLNGVVPVMGLLAEAARAATLTERDSLVVERLAEMDGPAFDRMTAHVERFVDSPSPADPAARSRLLGKLGLYGVRYAVELVRAGASGALQIRAGLSKRSGIEALQKLLAQQAGPGQDVLRAVSLLQEADRLTWGPATGEERAAWLELRDGVEALLLQPSAHLAAERHALRQVRSGTPPLPADLAAEATTVLEGPIVAPARPQLQAAMDRWRTVMACPRGPEESRVARVVLRSYQLAWERAAG